MESNYRQNLRQAASFGDYNDRSSSSYNKTMRRIYERSQRHQDAQDLNHLYSNDVSVLKKLKITEKSLEQQSRPLPSSKGGKTVEPLQVTKRKTPAKPTASEQRNI